jgi:MSHA biogenesis protein MshL
MKRLFALLLLLALVSCAEQPKIPQQVDPAIVSEMNKALERRAPPQPAVVSEALLPDVRPEVPRAPAMVEPRFDLVVNNAPAEQVFMSIVSGTRYSMLVAPSVSGSISVNLKDVTVREAMDSIRDVYGYDYRIDGTRIAVLPAGLQMRVFQINYLIGARQGRSDMRVSTGSGTGVLGYTNNTGTPQVGGTPAPVAMSPQQVNPALANQPPSFNPTNPAGALAGITTDASRMSTVQLTDFWAELAASLRTIVGNADGRSVVISPQSGVVVVRALPLELREVERFLKSMQLSVERQVMLEAKIIDVTLSDGYQAGVNWAAFPTNGFAGGFTSNATSTPLTAANGATLQGNAFSGNPVQQAIGALGAALASPTGPGGVVGLAFQTKNFAALLEFLQSQGTVQVLSSPRIATLNNQKAVLKVGLDELFVTNIAPTTINTTNAQGLSTTLISAVPVLGSIFAGISLDITPQIDDSGNITLHVHPLFSRVSTKTLNLNFGTGIQPLDLPIIDVSESDTMVRTTDGNIIALGGLMRMDLTDDKQGVPGLADIPGLGAAFHNTNKSRVKRELVILIKPTIIQGDREMEKDIRDARERMVDYGTPTPEAK